LVGPLKKTTGGFTHLLVTIDKFSKWIEARPITSIRSEQAVLFFTDIVHRFRVPNCIITDNGTQFTGKKFLDFCDNHHICVHWSAIAHPKTNGQVERANGMVLQSLKPRIFDKLNKHDKKWLPAPLNPMEPKNNAESSHRVHSVLLNLRIQGHTPN
jgi:transposase InsO family protein